MLARVPLQQGSFVDLISSFSQLVFYEASFGVKKQQKILMIVRDCSALEPLPLKVLGPRRFFGVSGPFIANSRAVFSESILCRKTWILFAFVYTTCFPKTMDITRDLSMSRWLQIIFRHQVPIHLSSRQAVKATLA